MTERSFANFTSGIWTSNTSNSVITYTLTRNLAWTSVDTGISGLVSTDYITLDENIIVDGGGYTITISESEHTGIFKINSSISSINSGPIIQNIQINAGSGNIVSNGGSLVATEQNYFYIYNCIVSGTLSNANSGGLCGSKCTNNVIKNCISTCILSGNYCGGIVGSDYGYFNSGSSWNQLGDDIFGVSGDNSGYSVSISSDGTIMATGATYSSAPSGWREGKTSIYRYESSVWTKKGSDIYGENSSDRSGETIALSSDGTIVAIGTTINNSYTGHVRIYEWSGADWTSGDWVQKGSDIDGEATGDWSSNSISLSSDGTIVAIGARRNNDTASNAGHVRVYEWSGSAWDQKGSDIDGLAENDNFGRSVSLSSDGTILAVGAIRSSGSVSIYEWSGSSWDQKGSIINGEDLNQAIGMSVDISSDGSIVATGSTSVNGIVRIYEYNLGTTSWDKLGDDILGEASGDNAGESISLSSDGTIIAIGARYNDGTGSNAGHARIYQWSGSAWSQLGIDLDGEFAGDYSGLGLSLSSDGTIVAIGAYSNDESSTNAGQVKVYELQSGSSILSSINTIEKSFCQPASAITGDYCGGIIGGYTISSSFTGTTTISKCFFDGTLNNTSGTVASGGIIGYKGGAYTTLIVSNCFAINTGASATYYAGLLGPESVGTITNCYSDGLIAYNSTLTESNNYDYSSYTSYASSLPAEWSISIWESTSGNYPRLKSFITDNVWSGNSSDNHTSMDYSISFSEEVVDNDIISVYITSTERNNVKDKTITSDGDEVTQLIDFSNIATENKKSVRHSMLNNLFINNTSISKLKMTPDNLGLSTTNFDKTYIMAFKQGTDSTPQINLSNEIDENTGVYANLYNTGDVIEFVDNGGTSITITKRSDGDYDVDDGETTHVTSDDTTLIVDYYTIYFGGVGINEGQQIPCFTDTCYLLTPFGYKNVTKLKKNDLVVTADKRKVKIKNIYKTKASSLYRPYLINKGGLGNNLPTIDTYISPEHRLLHNGKWIKPKNTLFKKSWNKSEIVYYHVELPNYKTDNVICNGVVMESWNGMELYSIIN